MILLTLRKKRTGVRDQSAAPATSTTAPVHTAPPWEFEKGRPSAGLVGLGLGNSAEWSMGLVLASLAPRPDVLKWV